MCVSPYLYLPSSLERSVVYGGGAQVHLTYSVHLQKSEPWAYSVGPPLDFVKNVKKGTPPLSESLNRPLIRAIEGEGTPKSGTTTGQVDQHVGTVC